MSKLYFRFLGIFLILLPNITIADCNINITNASNSYLLELEKSKLYPNRYKDVCQILSNEWKKCTKDQKKVLRNKIDMSKTLGNICMPHLRPPIFKELK